MEPTSPKRLCGRLRLQEVLLHHVVSPHHDLAERGPVPRDVVHLLVHHAHRVGDEVGLTLAGEESGQLFVGEVSPARLPRAYGDRAVGLGEAIDVDGPEVELAKAAEQGGGGRRSGDGHRHVLIEPVGRGMMNDADVYGRGTVVVRHALRLEELPDPARFHAPQADMPAGDRGHRPGEAPSVAVEHRKRPQVHAAVA